MDAQTSSTGTVVVGVDGSAASRQAVEFALADAVRRGARLRVVAAAALPDHWALEYGAGLPPARAEVLDRVRADAQRLVDQVVAAHPGVPAGFDVLVEAVLGTPAEVLVEASLGAEVLVLGHRGRGALRSALLGSVGLQCVLHAASPVTVVRPVTAPTPAGAVPPIPSTAAQGAVPVGEVRGVAMHRTTVSDVMTRTVLSVGPDACFAEIAAVLFSGAVRAVPVLDADGVLLGVVSEADLLVSAERADPEDRPWWRRRPRHTRRRGAEAKVGATTARELMSAPAVAVGPEVTVAAAARTMREDGLSWMPVVDARRRVVGVLGRSDLLAVFLREDTAIRDEIVDGVLRNALGVDPRRVAVEVRDGVVVLEGELETRAEARMAVRLTERVEGVVEVVDRVRHIVDERVADRGIAPMY